MGIIQLGLNWVPHHGIGQRDGKTVCVVGSATWGSQTAGGRAHRMRPPNVSAGKVNPTLSTLKFSRIPIAERQIERGVAAGLPRGTKVYWTESHF